MSDTAIKAILRRAVPPLSSRAGRGPAIIVSASIGAGHDGAAREIGRRLRAAGQDVESYDFLDLLPPGWGKAIRSGYARQLAVAPRSWGGLLALAGRPAGTAAAVGLSMAAARRRMRTLIPPTAPVVISTYPLASQVLGRLGLDMPVMAMLTDPSVHPLCAAPGCLHLAPNADAAQRIRADFGLPVVTVSPVVDPRFRPARTAADVLEGRRQHGLPLSERLAVVVAGSWGVGDIEATVRDMVAAGSAVPVVVCGRNDALRRRLAGDVIALGWVDDMPSLIRAADVVVHNAGGLTSLEAMAGGVPVISYRCLPGHGVANAAVLDRIGLSAWPRSPRDLLGALGQALDGDLRQRQQAAYADLIACPDVTDVLAGVHAEAALTA